MEGLKEDIRHLNTKRILWTRKEDMIVSVIRKLIKSGMMKSDGERIVMLSTATHHLMRTLMKEANQAKTRSKRGLVEGIEKIKLNPGNSTKNKTTIDLERPAANVVKEDTGAIPTMKDSSNNWVA